MVAVISILIGALLGTRCWVLCLVPVTLAGTATLAALDQLNGAPLASTALTVLALAVGLHLGYVAGRLVRPFGIVIGYDPFQQRLHVVWRDGDHSRPVHQRAVEVAQLHKRIGAC